MSSVRTTPSSLVFLDEPELRSSAGAAEEAVAFVLNRDGRYSYLMRRLAEQRPPFFRAIVRDVYVYAGHRGERTKLQTRFGRWVYALRLPFVASEYLGLVLYRLRLALFAKHVPLIPSILGWICALCWNIRIDYTVVIDEGVYIAHGQTVIGGLTYIGKRTYLSPFISIGLVQSNPIGPHIGDGVFVGTGARILGPLTIGNGARIGANAVVLSDVPAQATAAGVPARVIQRTEPA